MQKLRKIISAALVVATLLCALASCGKKTDPQGLIATANAALNEDVYGMKVLVKYESESEEMKAAISSFSSPLILVEVDKDSFKAVMETQKDLDIHYVNYTYSDGVLYTEWYENGATVKEQIPVGHVEKAELLATYGGGAGIGAEDFDVVVAEKVKGVDVVTCTVIQDEPLESLIGSLDEQLATVMNADVAIKDVTLVLEIEDGKYKLATLNCVYFITTGSGSYSVTMTYTTEFTYGAESKLTDPAA